MTWHRIEHKITGEVQIVASLDGIDTARWTAVPVKANRPPGEGQIVNADGSTGPDHRPRVLNVEERIAELERRVAGLERGAGQ